MRKQQKLGKRKTYTPLNTSLVQSSVVLSLNKEETLSEQDSKTLPNNLEENQQQHTVVQTLSGIVYVSSKEGKPLMPTTSPKARRLLKENKAKVVKRKPFTIQLLVSCREETQPIILGIDAGYSKIGFSAITDKKELISGELELRKDVSRNLQEKAMYRRLKRSKLWYRQSRFDNRKKSEGWLAPSIQHKLDTHKRLIEKIKILLPITKTIIEVATFDTQKMQNPEISGIEYQQGTLQGYEVREYLLEKFNRTCAYCHKKNMPLQIEHIIPKSREGSNRVSNLTISCHKCNQKKGNLTAKEYGHPEVQTQARKNLKATAFMNNIHKKLINKLQTETTYGYITKYNRTQLGLSKTHYNDAFAISGTIQERVPPYILKQIRRNNRCLQTNRKGYKPSIRRQRYKLQPNDLVKYQNQKYKVKGVHSYGNWVTLLDTFNNKINTNIKNVGLITYGKGLSVI